MVLLLLVGIGLIGLAVVGAPLLAVHFAAEWWYNRKPDPPISLGLPPQFVKVSNTGGRETVEIPHERRAYLAHAPEWKGADWPRIRSCEACGELYHVDWGKWCPNCTGAD